MATAPSSKEGENRVSDIFRFFLVGLQPVRVSYRRLPGLAEPTPCSAEIFDRRTGTFRFDTTYLSDIDDGEEVREIDERRFAELTQSRPQKGTEDV